MAGGKKVMVFFFVALLLDLPQAARLPTINVAANRIDAFFKTDLQFFTTIPPKKWLPGMVNPN